MSVLCGKTGSVQIHKQARVNFRNEWVKGLTLVHIISNVGNQVPYPLSIRKAGGQAKAQLGFESTTSFIQSKHSINCASGVVTFSNEIQREKL